jgi:hypothetical protein
VVENGLRCDRFRGYKFDLSEDWISFVQANKDQALQEIAEAGHHAATRFILTTASKPGYEVLRSAQFRAQLGLRPDDFKS